MSLQKVPRLIQIFQDLNNGIHIPNWRYQHLGNRLGMWKDMWYYQNNLIYEEGINSHLGNYSHDHLNHIVWCHVNNEYAKRFHKNTQVKVTHTPWIVNIQA